MVVFSRWPLNSVMLMFVLCLWYFYYVYNRVLTTESGRERDDAVSFMSQLVSKQR